MKFCPHGLARPDQDCVDQSQCWEQCGALGNSEEHAVVVESRSVWEISNGETFSVLVSSKEKADKIITSLGATSGAIAKRIDVW